MIQTAGRFLRQSLLSYKAMYGYLNKRIFLLQKVGNPILQLVFFAMLAKYIYHTRDSTPWIIGNAFLLSVYNALFGVGTVMNHERQFGTLKVVVSSPSNKFSIFAGRAFFHILDGLFSVIIGLTIGVLFFNCDFSRTNLPLFFLVIIISMFAAMGMGLLIGSLGLVLTDMNLLLNLSMSLLLIFCGSNFPVERLPAFLQPISYFLPMTRGIKACRLIANGQITPYVWQLISMELLVGVIYTMLGYLLFIYFERLARKQATLDIY